MDDKFLPDYHSVWLLLHLFCVYSRQPQSGLSAVLCTELAMTVVCMQVFCSAFGISLATTEVNAVHAWIAIIIPLIAAFCLIRNLQTLSVFSMTAHIFMATSLGIILYEEIDLFV